MVAADHFTSVYHFNRGLQIIQDLIMLRLQRFKQISKKLIRKVFAWVRKTILIFLGLLRYMIDWEKKNAPLFPQIRRKAETNRDSHMFIPPPLCFSDT